MKKKEEQPRATLILNGTKVWFTVLAFIFIHGGTGVWWASKISNKVDTIEIKVDQVITTVESNRKEAKQDNKDLRSEVNHARQS